jgi:hypothetical protein
MKVFLSNGQSLPLTVKIAQGVKITRRYFYRMHLTVKIAQVVKLTQVA